MKDIDFKLLVKDDNNAIYEVYLRKRMIGKIYITKEKESAVIKYDFKKHEFSSLTGVLLLNEILISALCDFKDCKESKIYFKEDQLIDYYDDVFAITKKTENENVCYSLKR